MSQYFTRDQRRQRVGRESDLLQRAVGEVRAEQTGQRQERCEQRSHPENAGPECPQQRWVGAHTQRKERDHDGIEEQLNAELRLGAQREPQVAPQRPCDAGPRWSPLAGHVLASLRPLRLVQRLLSAATAFARRRALRAPLSRPSWTPSSRVGATARARTRPAGLTSPRALAGSLTSRAALICTRRLRPHWTIRPLRCPQRRGRPRRE